MLIAEYVQTNGWEAAIRGMRNPMNSWAKSDSVSMNTPRIVRLGANDLKLCKQLINAGSDHRKFLRQINISMDIDAPLYWWKEFDTYKIGTAANSCSTMHKIHSKPFTITDFSYEHLNEESLKLLSEMITHLNDMRDRCITAQQAKDNVLFKNYWWQLIQLLPTSYNQRRTVTLDYEVAMRIYFARKNHKLDEWHTLCHTFELFLPYFKEFFLED